MSPRDTAGKEWEQLDQVQRDDMALRMAVYAAQIEHVQSNSVARTGRAQHLGRIHHDIFVENTARGRRMLAELFFLGPNGKPGRFAVDEKRRNAMLWNACEGDKTIRVGGIRNELLGPIDDVSAVFRRRRGG